MGVMRGSICQVWLMLLCDYVGTCFLAPTDCSILFLDTLMVQILLGDPVMLYSLFFCPLSLINHATITLGSSRSTYSHELPGLCFFILEYHHIQLTHVNSQCHC